MVKPQLNLDKKEDVKTPDGGLVKVITVHEPPPIKQEPVYPPTTTRTGCRAGKVLCTLVCTLLFIVLLFMLVSYLFYPYGYSGFTCGVSYFDEGDYYGQDYIDYFESWSSEGPMPYGNDMLFAPRPTGAPLLRYLEEGVSFNEALTLIRIETPTNGDRPGVTVVHDFELRLSAYKVPSSEVCYIQPLDFDSALNPEDFQSLLESEAYRNQEFPLSREVYVVDPNEPVTGVGEHIEEMCNDYASYYIHSIPTDQVPTFWQTAREVVSSRTRGPSVMRGRDHSSSDEEHEGRRHGSNSRSSEEGEHEARGDRRHSSSSSSEERDHEASIRRRSLRGY